MLFQDIQPDIWYSFYNSYIFPCACRTHAVRITYIIMCITFADLFISLKLKMLEWSGMRKTIASKTCAGRALGIAIGITVLLLMAEVAGAPATMKTPTATEPATRVQYEAAAGQSDHPKLIKIDDGAVWAWGDNREGRLGDGTYTDQNTPVQVQGLTRYTATVIAAGNSAYIVLKDDGTVWTWGISPVQVSGLSGVTAIAAGDAHYAALKNDSTVWTWGKNGYGQLGDGTTTNRQTPLKVSGLSGVTAIAAGDYHTIALTNDGTVWTWGKNGTGQLGDGTDCERDGGIFSDLSAKPIPCYKTNPVQVSGLSGVTAIAAGGSHSVALTNDGKVWTWGADDEGQLGINNTCTSGGYVISPSLGYVPDTSIVTPENCHYHAPVQVSGLSGITAIAAGGGHTVALMNNGTVWAWGKGQLTGHPITSTFVTPNPSNPLSDPTVGWVDTTDRNNHHPHQVSVPSGVTTIAAGGDTTLALKNDGTVWAWGDNSGPVQVSGLSNVTAIAAGDSYSIAISTTSPATPTPTATVTATPTVSPTPAVTSEAAIPTIITLQGSLASSPTNTPVKTGSIKVTIKDTSGAQVWQGTLNNVFNNGEFSVQLGAEQELRLVLNELYQIEVAIDADSSSFSTADVTFGDGSPAGDIIKFRA